MSASESPLPTSRILSRSESRLKPCSRSVFPLGFRHFHFLLVVIDSKSSLSSLQPLILRALLLFSHFLLLSTAWSRSLVFWPVAVLTHASINYTILSISNMVDLYELYDAIAD